LPIIRPPDALVAGLAQLTENAGGYTVLIVGFHDRTEPPGTGFCGT
jgi:hypothetical protein